MNVVHIFTDIDAIPAEERPTKENIVHVKDGLTFVRLPSGMKSGRSSVAVICDLPGGKKLFAELSMANFEGVGAAFRGAEQRAKECDGRN